MTADDDVIVDAHGVSRRDLLRMGAAAGVVALAACRTAPKESAPKESANVPPDPPAPPQDAPRTPAPWVDGLCFLPEKPESLRASGLSALVLDCSAGEMKTDADGKPAFVRSFEACLRSLVAVRRELRLPDWSRHAFVATRGSEVARAQAEGRTAVLLQFQGCDPVGEDLSRVDLFHELGLRVLQITHHFDNPVGGGCMTSRPTGLTPFGIQVVERMNELGILPDLSHASDLTCRDVLAASSRPVILSHGAARALCDNPRCLPDDVLRAVGESGGVCGIFMMSFWLTRDPVPTTDHLVAQLRHVQKVAGIGAVGIANDYPVTGEVSLAAIGNDNAKGIANYLPWWHQMRDRGVPGFAEDPVHVVIPELNQVRRFFVIDDALARAGFTSTERAQVLGGNWTRVLTDVLG